MHKAITYLWKNYNIIQNPIVQKILINESLSTNWKEETLTQELIFEISNANLKSSPTKEDVDIIVSPIDSSRDSYSEYGIYCSDYQIDEDQPTKYILTFKCEEQPKKPIDLSILVLRTVIPKFNFSLTEFGEEEN